MAKKEKTLQYRPDLRSNMANPALRSLLGIRQKEVHIGKEDRKS